jgi:hypothetical protein
VTDRDYSFEDIMGIDPATHASVMRQWDAEGDDLKAMRAENAITAALGIAADRVVGRLVTECRKAGCRFEIKGNTVLIGPHDKVTPDVRMLAKALRVALNAGLLGGTTQAGDSAQNVTARRPA